MRRAIVALAMLLAACGSTVPATPTQPVAPATPAVQAATPAVDAPATIAAAVQATLAAAPKVVAPTAVATIAPTIAPTTAPTVAPPAVTKPAAPTAAPAAKQLTAEQVIGAFKAAGLEAESPRVIQRQDRGMAPLVGEGMHFLVPSVCSDCGGRVFIVTSTADRDLLANYYRDLGRQSAAFFSHVFVRDNVVVQINGDLKDDQAAKYEAALKGL